MHRLPTWLIYDPVRHRYFNVPAETIDILAHWAEGDADSLIAKINTATGRRVGTEDIADIMDFLFANNLTDMPAEGGFLTYVEQIERSKKSLLSHVIHGYLFVRIPLFRPERFLRRTLPFVRPLLTVTAIQIILLITVAGLYLVSREWDAFAGTFLHFFTIEGAVFYAVALMIIKGAHELGHAYVATRYGVRVSTMGIAFLLMFPLPYTDVTDAWRLRSRRERLLIDAAGIFVELAIAGLMTFLWVFLPDGMLRSLAFVLATTSWVLSLALNLNPFMRFDGYYLLADSWGIANLQDRSFALARWRLRETLFGLGLKPPEIVGRRRANRMILYAYGVWLYRLLLFIGIALIVYHYFFKVLGVFLFVVEILWFIALPVAREIKVWWEMRKDIMKTSRTLITGMCVVLLAIAVITPWNRTIILPAVLTAEKEFSVFTAAAGKISRVFVREGQFVRKGDVLLVTTSREVEHEKTQAARRIVLLEARIARRAGDRRERDEGAVLKEQLTRERRRREGWRAEEEKLTIRAPADGIVRNVVPDLHTNQWIEANRRIAIVIAPQRGSLTAFVSEENLWRLQKNDEGVFIPDDPDRAKENVRIAEISFTGTEALGIPYLASVYGGPIAVEKDEDNTLKPLKGQYLVEFTTDAGSAAQVLRGVVRVKGRSESFARGFMRRFISVLVRETSV